MPNKLIMVALLESCCFNYYSELESELESERNATSES